MASTYVAMEGGLDLEVPPLESRPGALLEGLNVYESVRGGYTTLAGYERYDGSTSPSSATYTRVEISDINLAAGAVDTAVGQTITAGPITGTVIYRAFNFDNTAVVLVLTDTTGDTPLAGDYPIAFDTDASIVSILANGEALYDWESDEDTYLALAQDNLREQITPVPGEGPIRGVAQINGSVLAWRDNVGATELRCYKANAGTWELIPTVSLVRVDSIVDEPVYGDVCNGGNDVILGVYKSFDNSGTEVPAEKVYAVKRVSGGAPTAFTRDSDSADCGSVLEINAFTPAAGGDLRTINHNFLASPASYNVYFGDGVNCAMFYNVSQGVIQPISGDYRRLPETCKHVIAFNQRLFMSTTGGTFLTSAIGQPDVLDGFLGAQEIGVGDEITGFATTSSENLAIFTRNRTFAFLGNSAETWQKRIASENSGARDGCFAQIDDVFAADDRGITQLSRVEALGGFDAGTVTDDIQTLWRGLASEATCATTLRQLNQMRFYFGGRFLVLSRVPYNANGNEGIRYGITEGIYPIPVRCISTDEDAVGQERTLFGSDDGFVYRMDIGTSFDGEEIETIISLHYQDLNAPSIRKRWTGVEIEAKTAGEATCDVFYYMNDGTKTFEPRTLEFPGAPGTFNLSTWNTAMFDGVPLVRPKMKLRGTGYNLQFSFYRKSRREPQLTLTGYSLRYKARGLVPL